MDYIGAILTMLITWYVFKLIGKFVKPASRQPQEDDLAEGIVRFWFVTGPCAMVMLWLALIYPLAKAFQAGARLYYEMSFSGVGESFYVDSLLPWSIPAGVLSFSISSLAIGVAMKFLLGEKFPAGVKPATPGEHSKPRKEKSE